MVSSRVKHARAAFWGYLFCHVAVSNALIGDLILTCNTNFIECPQGYGPVPDQGGNNDLNQGTSNQKLQVGLCQKPPSPAGKLVTQVFILSNPDKLLNCEEYLGSGYVPVPHDNGCTNNDLNQGAGGLYIGLCYERQFVKDGDGLQPIDLQLVTSDTPPGPCPQGYNRVHAPVAREANQKFDDDLNQGSGGKYILMCYTEACQFGTPQGKWHYKFQLVSSTTGLTFDVGSTNTASHGTTSTEADRFEKSLSIGLEASYGPATGSVEASFTGETSTEVAREMHNEIVSSSTEKFTQNFGDRSIGKVVWQWEVTAIEKGCAGQVLGKAPSFKVQSKSFALTPDISKPPCCLPGFAVDAEGDSFTCATHSSRICVDSNACPWCKVAERKESSSFSQTTLASDSGSEEAITLRGSRHPRASLASALRGTGQHLMPGIADETTLLQLPIEGADEDVGDLVWSEEL